jgi:hypothetical protein
MKKTPLNKTTMPMSNYANCSHLPLPCHQYLFVLDSHWIKKLVDMAGLPPPMLSQIGMLIFFSVISGPINLQSNFIMASDLHQCK